MELNPLILFLSNRYLGENRPRLLQTKFLTIFRKECVDEKIYLEIMNSIDGETNNWDETSQTAFWRAIKGVHDTSITNGDDVWEKLCRGLSYTGLNQLLLVGIAKQPLIETRKYVQPNETIVKSSSLESRGPPPPLPPRSSPEPPRPSFAAPIQSKQEAPSIQQFTLKSEISFYAHRNMVRYNSEKLIKIFEALLQHDFIDENLTLKVVQKLNPGYPFNIVVMRDFWQVLQLFFSQSKYCNDGKWQLFCEGLSQFEDLFEMLIERRFS